MLWKCKAQIPSCFLAQVINTICPLGIFSPTKSFVMEGRKVPIKLSFNLKRKNTTELQMSASKTHWNSCYSFSQGGKCPRKFSHCRTTLIMRHKLNWTKKHKIIHANLVVPNTHSFNWSKSMKESNQHIEFSIRFWWEFASTSYLAVTSPSTLQGTWVCLKLDKIKRQKKKDIEESHY